MRSVWEKRETAYVDIFLKEAHVKLFNLQQSWFCLWEVRHASFVYFVLKPTREGTDCK